jgi:hypothetical protein
MNNENIKKKLCFWRPMRETDNITAIYERIV